MEEQNMRGVHTDKVIIDEVQGLVPHIDMNGTTEAPCIADMNSEGMEALVNSGDGSVVLQQLVAAMLCNTELSGGEILVSDKHIREAMDKMVEINRFKDFFHLRIIEPAQPEED